MEVRRQNNNYLIGWGCVRVVAVIKGAIISKYLVRVDLSDEQNKKEESNIKKKREGKGIIVKKERKKRSTEIFVHLILGN